MLVKKQILDAKNYGIYPNVFSELLKKKYINVIDSAILCYIINVKHSPTQSNIRANLGFNLKTIKSSLSKMFSLDLIVYGKADDNFKVYFELADLQNFHNLLEKDKNEVKDMLSKNNVLELVISEKRKIKKEI